MSKTHTIQDRREIARIQSNSVIFWKYNKDICRYENERARVIAKKRHMERKRELNNE